MLPLLLESIEMQLLLFRHYSLQLVTTITIIQHNGKLPILAIKPRVVDKPMWQFSSLYAFDIRYTVTNISNVPAAKPMIPPSPSSPSDLTKYQPINPAGQARRIEAIIVRV
jgi:hypothetical protein